MLHETKAQTSILHTVGSLSMQNAIVFGIPGSQKVNVVVLAIELFLMRSPLGVSIGIQPFMETHPNSES
jgi:hypothetical protein